MSNATIDTHKLEGRDLDYAVTMADGWTVGERPPHWKCRATFAFLKPDDALCPTCSVPHYCEPYEAEKVMRIMERERIEVRHLNDGWCAEVLNHGKHYYATRYSLAFDDPNRYAGPALAILRCYVSVKLGSSIPLIDGRKDE